MLFLAPADTYLSAAQWGSSDLGKHSTRADHGADRLKWPFFAIMGLAVLLVIRTDERFWINPADPHWKHIAPVKSLLIVHGLAGLTALATGAPQIVEPHPQHAHRAPPRAGQGVYRALSASPRRSPSISAPARSSPSLSMSSNISRAGCGSLSALIAWACIRSGQMPMHKAWMMRSYGFTLIFVLSRVPDAFIAHYSDQFLSDMLWSLVVVALIAPDIILTAQTLLRIRGARARQASAAAATA